MRLMRKLSDMIVYIGKQKMYPLLIVFFLGIAFFFILGQLYYSVRKKAYCEKLERTFKEVLLRQLQEDSFEGYLSTSERKRQLEEYPDTVYLTDESGEHGYYLDREKSRRNIAHDPRLRILHSAYLVEHPLVVDSLYGKWQQHLEQQKMFTAFALQFFLSDKDGNTTSCVFPNDLLLEDYIACFDITIGYRCEVELKGFCSFSFFDLVGTRGIIYAFIYWLLIITSIIMLFFLSKKHKNILIPTSAHVYQLDQNIIFDADLKKLIVGKEEILMKPQISVLLRHFLEAPEFILKDEEINVDMISQVTVDDFVQIEITLDQEFQLKLNQAIMKLKDEFKQIQIYQIRKYAKVAVGGKLVETTPGLAAEVFDVLGQANIHFYQITTSKRTISLVIDKKNLDQAIQLLKERFHIEEDK